MSSHPMWVRGLKHQVRQPNESSQRSHPMWVRGLKHNTDARVWSNARVAPYVGAWIETSTSAR